MARACYMFPKYTIEKAKSGKNIGMQPFCLSQENAVFHNPLRCSVTPSDGGCGFLDIIPTVFSRV